VLLLERRLLSVGVATRLVVVSRPTGKRQRGAPVPRLAWERRVDLHTLALDGDRDKAVNIDKTLLGDDFSYLGAEKLQCARAIQRVDAVHDQRLGLREPLRQCPGEEQMLGGAGTATIAQHPLYRALARATIRQPPHSFDELEEGCAGIAKRGAGP
jgi:hypothetical protein